jgi:hypothetical protein
MDESLPLEVGGKVPGETPQLRAASCQVVLFEKFDAQSPDIPTLGVGDLLDASPPSRMVNDEAHFTHSGSSNDHRHQLDWL